MEKLLISLYLLFYQIKEKQEKEKEEREREKGYPTASIKSSPNRAVFEIDQFSDIINVCISTIREHGSTAGEKEPITVVTDPILHGLLNSEFTVRHVSKPSNVSASRPREGIPVAIRRRHPTSQSLIFQRTVPFPIYHSAPLVS